MKITFSVTFREGVAYDLPPQLAKALIMAGYAQGETRNIRVVGPSCRKIVHPGEYKDGRKNS